MSSSIRTTKSILAKLLAAENIDVIYRSVKTAYFDLDKRQLICPIWDDVSPELYDLLMGHEVGHARYTPKEGWHSEVTGEQGSGFKSYLNVIEDVRIEKLIKESYPGLKKSFAIGYSDLWRNDFFGVTRIRDINELSLIDRINLHTKIGAFLCVKFSAEEKEILRAVENCQSWEDVVSAAHTVFDYTKNQESNKIRNLSDLNSTLSDAARDALNQFLTEEDETDTEDFDVDISDEVPEDEHEDEAEEEEEIQIESETFDLSSSDEEQCSVTDTIFRNKEESLLADADDVNKNLLLPEVDLDKAIVTAKDQHLFIMNAIKEKQRDIYTLCLETSYLKASEENYSKFMKENKGFIRSLVKEFELKKNAKRYSRTKFSRSGELDMKNISRYKISSDIFKKMEITKEGKSHGVVFFLDMSGSMGGDKLYYAIQQLVVLCEFCRLVNIPFVAYGFTSERRISSINGTYCGSKYVFSDAESENDFIDRSDNSVLYELQNSNHNLKTYKQSMYRLINLQKQQKPDFRSNVMGAYEPRLYTLSNTPLNFAVISSISIIEKFKAVHDCEIVNSIFLTDGDATDDIVDRHFKTINDTGYPTYRTYKNIYVKHKSGNFVKLPHNTTDGLLRLCKKVTNCNLISFFFSAGRYGDASLLNDAASFNNWTPETFEQNKREINKRGYGSFPCSGYDEMFFVKNNILAHREMMDNAKWKNTAEGDAKSIKKNFLSLNRSTAANKLLAGAIAEKIAKQLD